MHAAETSLVLVYFLHFKEKKNEDNKFIAIAFIKINSWRCFGHLRLFFFLSPIKV